MGNGIDLSTTIKELYDIRSEFRRNGEYRKSNMLDCAISYLNKILNNTEFKEEKIEDRKVVLLKACKELLEKQENSHYVLNLSTETVFYDGAECDGSCLLEDIKSELEL